MKHCFLLMWMMGLVFAGNLEAYAQEGSSETGQVRVMTVPDGATVECDGIAYDVSPVNIPNLAVGKHLIVVRKVGFEEARDTVEIERAGQRLPVTITMEPVRGLVLMTSEPEGAEVIVESVNRGKTPLLLTDLALGTYPVLFRRVGYRDQKVELSVDSRKPRQLSVVLGSSTAALELRSTPSGARVILNGIDRGTTPTVVENIPEGEATLELVLDGCEPYQQSLRMQAGTREKMTAVLKEIESSIKVVSIPETARVYMDDQFRGETPLTLTGLSSGDYRVRVEAEGYDPMRRVVTLKRAEELVEEFRLTRNSGSIEIITSPAGVQVLVDGKDRGTTMAPAGQTDRVSDPLKITGVPIGVRQLTLVRKGFFNAKAQVTVERDKTVTVHHALKRRFIPNCEVITASRKYRGVLVDIDPEGNVKLELSPGVFLEIKKDDIITRRALRELDPGDGE